MSCTPNSYHLSIAFNFHGCSSVQHKFVEAAFPVVGVTDQKPLFLGMLL